MIWIKVAGTFLGTIAFRDLADDAWQEHRMASFILDITLMMATVALMVLTVFFQFYK